MVGTTKELSLMFILVINSKEVPTNQILGEEKNTSVS
jgi:hypothetical protein